MVQVCSLASGSSGNAYLFCTKNENILVDAGISYRRIRQKLDELGKEKIDAALITHEHIDHVRALGQLQKAGVQLYMSKGTFNAYRSLYGDISTRIIKAGEEARIGSVSCMPFGKCHDALEPLSYALTSGGRTASFMTDLGHVCKDAKEMMAISHAMFIESNHDVEMLRSGSYPQMLKQRILGKFGHLSNEDAAMGVLENATHKLKNVFLSHLSESNNTHDIALGTFKSIVKERQDLDICCKVSPRHCTAGLTRI